MIGKKTKKSLGKASLGKRWKITKQIMGENRYNDISFRQLMGYCQKMKDVVKKTESFPKRGIYASFGKDSTYEEYKEWVCIYLLWTHKT